MTTNTDWEREFVEKGAALEHARWARWQNYLHQMGHEADGYLLIPMNEVERWERQIVSSYDELSDAEKESDRKEVREYLPLIKQLLEEEREKVKETLRPYIQTHPIDKQLEEAERRGAERAVDYIQSELRKAREKTFSGENEVHDTTDAILEAARNAPKEDNQTTV